MEDATNFDIDAYNVEELINIIGLGHEIPLTNDKIVSTIQEFKDRFEKKINDDGENKPVIQGFMKFFDSVQEKLLLSKKEETVRGLYDSEISSDTITRKAVEVNGREPSLMKLYDNEVMADTIMKTNNRVMGDTLPGYKNPYLRTIIKREFYINSKFRSTNSIDFCSGNTKVTTLNTNTNFNVSLTDDGLKNVTELSFVSASIPKSWHNFSSSYGTNYFVETTPMNISGNVEYADYIVIENGNYDMTTETTICQILNSKSARVKFTYNSNSGKISVTNNTSEKIVLIWYNKKYVLPNPCSSTNLSNGGKMNYNLGRVLGFESLETVLLGNETKAADSNFLPTGINNLIIVMEDFNNNKPNTELIVNETNKSEFAMPSYYVKTTMCKDSIVVKKTAVTNCHRPPIDTDITSNLTSAKQYTIAQIKLALGVSKSEFIEFPRTSNYFKLIDATPGTFNSVITVNELNLDYNKRVYFGPVDIKKLHIRLINEYGMEMDLNGRPWNFCFSATTSYQP